MPLPELKLIERLRRMAQSKKKHSYNVGLGALLTGIGDDCAVLRGSAREDLLVTTDFSLEGVHFRRDWHRAEWVGHRCLARGLSDIAAMGGRPMTAFLSLGAPRGLPQKWIDGFIEGFLRLARKFDVALGGGDTAESPQGVVTDVIVLGSVPKGEAVLRSGARVGDLVYVSGKLGAAAAELSRLNSAGKNAKTKSVILPTPRVKSGKELRRLGLASSMIDISDGLSTDLAHICEQSKVSAEIEAAAVPVAGGANLDFALHGGDDYELLFTAAPSKRVPDYICGTPITLIGEIQSLPGPMIWLRTPEGARMPLAAGGWQHFIHEKRPRN